MDSVNLELLPPQRLAVAYARSDLRLALTLLLAFDARLAEIVGRASEPMFAQIKFAWWYDVISRESETRPKGEPIVRALDEIAMPALEGAMEQLLDAWGELVAVDEWTQEILADFAKRRSAAVFLSYADWVGSEDDVSAIGESWALADLKRLFGARAGAAPHRMTSRAALNGKLRPLSILALSVTGPSGIRMIWHALTGR